VLAPSPSAAITGRAFAYSRVSSAHQASEGEGLQRQADMAAAWCARHGVVLDDSLSLEDSGLSASKGAHLVEGAALPRFLQLAQAGALGLAPVLIVEDVSRLSRLEPLDGLQRIFQPLVNAGVEIVTLEDGARYNLDRLNTDPSALIVLVLKIQAAADYARRLGRYASDARDRERQRIRSGEKDVRTGTGPSWVEWSGTDWVLNEYAETIRRLIELSWQYGQSITCRMLNSEGHRAPGGGAWSQVPIRSVLTSPALHGARCTAEAGYEKVLRDWKKVRDERNAAHKMAFDAWKKVRDKMKATGRGDKVPPEPQLDVPPKPKPVYIETPDIFPALISAEDHKALAATIRARASDPLHKGRRDQLRYIGQQLTTCTCGSLIGVRTVKPKRRDGTAGELRFTYLVCKGRERGVAPCSAPHLRMDPVQAHILTRLSSDWLAQALAAAAGDRTAAAATLDRRHQAATAALALATEQRANAAQAVKAAAKSGGLLVVLAEALAEAEAAVVAAEEELAGVVAEQRTHGGDGLDGEMRLAAAELLQAFAAGADTIEQRQAVHGLLRRLGVRITLDATHGAVALQVSDGAPLWQPIHGDLAVEALAAGQAEVTYANALVTGSAIREAMARIEAGGLSGDELVEVAMDLETVLEPGLYEGRAKLAE
jgi:DNA invertase Pin-like site-specific DNA recombinase